MQVLVKNCRLAFPNLFEARSFNGEGDASFSASLIIDKTNPSIKDLETTIKAVAEEKWGAKAMAELKALKAADKTALHDGDSKADYDGFPGNYYISARNKSRVLVIDRDKTPLTAADGKPYGGCYVNASIDLWAQANAFGKRINATLLAVQFVKDGESFSGAASASVDDFETIADDDAEGLV